MLQILYKGNLYCTDFGKIWNIFFKKESIGGINV